MRGSVATVVVVTAWTDSVAIVTFATAHAAVVPFGAVTAAIRRASGWSVVVVVLAVVVVGFGTKTHTE